ncbi:hypothetical protein CRE_14960 [Caenorhabditis remanei]|uniref:Uncharacterized protein n=1 Tax=Caenorhabditis remanei TaxID=31234 RepID=E3NBX7_CAERE|nr:hypothetical protein CRE_14960 [Caenorhabditis remanei]
MTSRKRDSAVLKEEKLLQMLVNNKHASTRYGEMFKFDEIREILKETDGGEFEATNKVVHMLAVLSAVIEIGWKSYPSSFA